MQNLNDWQLNPHKVIQLIRVRIGWDLVLGLPDTKPKSFIVLFPLWRAIHSYICLVGMALSISRNPGLYVKFQYRILLNRSRPTLQVCALEFLVVLFYFVLITLFIMYLAGCLFLPLDCFSFIHWAFIQYIGIYCIPTKCQVLLGVHLR